MQPIQRAVEHDKRSKASADDSGCFGRSMAQIAASDIFGVPRGPGLRNHPFQSNCWGQGPASENVGSHRALDQLDIIVASGGTHMVD
jgi:hypothetical protein